MPCRAWQVDRYVSSPLYLIEPEREEDRWITQRLYGGGVEDRLAQEILLGVGGVRLLQALGEKIDVYHFNEGHAVFAGLELLRQEVFGGGVAPGAARAAAAARRVHDAHAGPCRQRGPRPRRHAQDGRRPRLHR